MSEPNAYAPLLASLSPAALRDILAAAAGQLAQQPQPSILPAETAPVVDDRARRAVAVPQWTTADGAARGVVLQALSARQRREAEYHATERHEGRPGFGQANPRRQILEELRRGIVEPANLPITVIEGWNDDVVLDLHAHLCALGPLPPAYLAAELAALVGAAPPARPARGRPDHPVAGADDLDGDAGAGAGLEPDHDGDAG